MSSKINKRNNLILLLLVSIHYFITIALSRNFFIPLKDEIGKETFAYRFLVTGKTMQDDFVSFWLGYIFAHLLALLLIALFWKIVITVLYLWLYSPNKRKLIIFYLVVITLTIAISIMFYPYSITTTPDTRYNYVYARVWLPMYWHGFLTNVLHSACLLVFQHPISMSVVPAMGGVTAIFCLLCYHDDINKSAHISILFVLLLLFMPDSYEMLFFVGRNYTYAILAMIYVGYILNDYKIKTYLDIRKFIILSFMVIVLGTWRSEGILWIVSFPIIILCAYKRDDLIHRRRNTQIKTVIFICIFGLLYLPNKYGSEKYQDYDYFIINTPGPIASIWVNCENDLNYDEYNEDKKIITSVIPEDYIMNYGEMAMAYYNLDNLRSTRQCDVGTELGKRYVIAAYRMFVHRIDIYYKYQLNLFFQSIGVNYRFDLISINSAEYIENPNVKEWRNWISDYSIVGDDDVTNKHAITLINDSTDFALRSRFWKVKEKMDAWMKRCSGFIKISSIVLTLFIIVNSFFKRKWLYVVMGMVIIGILFAVITFAPSARANYYYASFYCIYWYIYNYLIYTKNKYGYK